MNTTKKTIKFSLGLIFIFCTLLCFSSSQNYQQEAAINYVRLGLCKVGNSQCASCVTSSHKSRIILAEVWDKETGRLYWRVRVKPSGTENVDMTLCDFPCGTKECNNTLYIKSAKFVE